METLKTRLDLVKEVFDRNLNKAIAEVEIAKSRLDLIRAAHKKDQEATQRWAEEIERQAGL